MVAVLWSNFETMGTERSVVGGTELLRPLAVVRIIA